MGAFAYFGLVFGTGFVLGVVRTFVVVPMIGGRAAELLEMPLMVLATILAARWVVLRFRVPDARRARLSMGILALSILMAAEIGPGVLLQGIPVSEYFTARDPISGSAYFLALGLFAAMPSLVGRAVKGPEGLIDRFMPNSDVAESHEILIHAPADIVFETAENLPLLSIPLIRAIFKLREILFRVHPDPVPVRKGIVRETMDLGWGVLARQPGREIVMGAVTQPWMGDVKFRAVAPAEFSAFAEPGFVKIAWTFEAEPLGNSGWTRFRTRTRVLATEEDARRKFLRYWTFAGIFIVLIRLLANPAIRREAERRRK